MSIALQMRTPLFANRLPIKAYGAGGFRFGDRQHLGPILCLPSNIYALTSCELEDSDRARMLAEAPHMDFFLLGCGDKFKPIPPQLASLLAQAGLRADTMTTGAAVRTYNVLLSEDRPVGALFFPVE